MKELINLRKKREKHFLNPNGSITAVMYNKDVHYLKNGKWEDIDNTLIDKGDFYKNKSNSFETIFTKNSKDLVNIKKDKYFLKMSCKSFEHLSFSLKNDKIKYTDLKHDINFEYEIANDKLKESVILNCREEIPEFLDFIFETNLDLRLNNKYIEATNEENQIIFIIEAPFMIDAAKHKNTNIEYILEKKENGYSLKLVLDTNWLLDKNTIFPVAIDPTITTDKTENVYDTYISNAEPERIYNGVSFLKLGADENYAYRTLLKFELPTIGTSCSIVNATAILTPYANCINLINFMPKPVTVHRITSDWDEKTACWNNMHDKFDSYVETYFEPNGTSPYGSDEEDICEVDLTSIVKKWYAGTENNGIMLIKNHEYLEDDDRQPYLAYSKSYDYNNGTAVRPYLTITYMYQNGILPYMDYNNLKFTMGTSKININNGNITNLFEVNRVINGKTPFTLTAVYNNCDVILDSIKSLAKGWKFNYEETLKKTTVDSQNTIEYVDETSAIHYFYEENNVYYDEEGLNLKIYAENGKYILADENNNKKEFELISNVYRLTRIVTISNDIITMNYTNGLLSKVSNGKEALNITYQENKVVVSGSYDTATITLDTSKRLISIQNKIGKTSFEYGSNNLVNIITDVDDVKTAFEYNETIPYRIKKVTTNYYSYMNSYNTYSYGFNTTSVCDKNDMKRIYTFNDRGNTIGTAVYPMTTEDLKEAYGYTQDFVDDYSINKNNISGEVLPLKYIKNLVLDSSFEESNTNIGTGTRVQNNARTGQYCCLIEDSWSYSYKISKKGIYTFSFYIKSAFNGIVRVIRKSNNENIFGESKLMKENSALEYVRYDVSGSFNENDEFIIRIDLDGTGGLAYIDDIQLEEGNVANLYNLLTNSDFSEGIKGWSIGEEDNYEIATISENQKALRLISDPSEVTAVSKFLNILGKAGDTYTLSFWYKNMGVLDTSYEFLGNVASLSFIDDRISPDDEEQNGGGTINLPLNLHNTEWQYFSATFTAEYDYTRLWLDIMSLYEANSLYVTNFMLIKDSVATQYNYDTNGNMVEAIDVLGNKNENIYDSNNVLVSSSDKQGNSYKFEYDNVIVDRVLRKFSPSGYTITNVYDEDGNIIKEVITNTILNGKIETNKKYYLRLKGTDKYLKYNFDNKQLTCKEDNCNHQYFKIEKVDDIYYRLKYENKNIAFNESSATLTSLENDNSLFSFVINPNGSVSLESKVFSNKVLTMSENSLTLSDFVKDSYVQQFYFEDVMNKKRIITEYEYDENKKLIRKTDGLGKSISYDIDKVTGLATSIISNNGLTENRLYNKGLLTKYSVKDKSVEYEYNDSNLVSKVKFGNDVYEVNYNEIHQITSISLNGKKLVKKIYSDKGKLTSVTYSNSKQFNSSSIIDSISDPSTTIYSYDKLGRISRTIKNNKAGHYNYSNLGMLTKIEYDKNTFEYIYDLSQRLQKYIINGDEYICKYNYDENNNITQRTIFIDDKEYVINYEYTKENVMKKIVVDSTINIDVDYDELGRAVYEDINGITSTRITYLSNGDITSTLISKIKIGEDEYRFKYNDIYSITAIYKNEKLIHEYKYSDLNELILEIDYELKRKTKYVYDAKGNMLSKGVYNLYGTKLHEDKFEYNNGDWTDQLTKINGYEITYDDFGNPLTFKDKKYTWINGTQIETYRDNTKAVSYEYNVDGERIKKTVGERTHNYYYDNSLLTIEKIDDNMLYFLYNNSENLIGFKYNNETYYYHKNIFNDIIGILNSNGEKIVTYEYDSWGNTISIKDNTENIIENPNHIGLINPYRYRSYYYDKDIELYVFKNRYYDPTLCRFINIDSHINSDILGTNLYLYCGNNPIMRTDSEGNLFGTIVVASCIGALIGITVKAVCNVIEEKSVTEGLGGAAISGGVGLALDAAKVNPVKSLVISTIAGETFEQIWPYLTKKKKANAKNISYSIVNGVVNTCVGVSAGAIADDIGGAISRDLLKINLVGRPATRPISMIIGKRAIKANATNAIKTGVSNLIADPFNDINGRIVSSIAEPQKKFISIKDTIGTSKVCSYPLE